MRSATPQVRLGDPVTGVGSDNLRLALNKYNAHTHLLAQPQRLLSSGITPNLTVQLLDDYGFPAFPTGTVVQAVNNTRVQASNPANRTIEDAVIQIGSLVFFNARITRDSNQITFSDVDGFVAGKQIAAYSSECLSSALSVSANTALPLLLAVPWNGVLTRISLMASTSSLVVALVNTRSGYQSAALPVDPVVRFYDFELSTTSRFDFQAGDSWFLKFTGVSAPVTVYSSLYFNKLIADG